MAGLRYSQGVEKLKMNEMNKMNGMGTRIHIFFTLA
jgi:hypothetical protein